MKALTQLKALSFPTLVVSLICFQPACSRQPEAVHVQKQLQDASSNGNGAKHSDDKTVALHQSKSSGNGSEKPSEDRDPEHEAILNKAEQFMKDYNSRDARSLAALFTEDAIMLERDGTVLAGRDEIEQAFKGLFAKQPDARISLSVDSLEMITPDVALERGKTIYFPDGATATLESEYNALHVKQDGAWLMSRTRTINRRVLSPYEHLRELEWMVGSWIDESEGSVVETVCKWSENKSYLLRKFTIHLEGNPVMNGTQRIGWDPVARQIKSWVYDSEGGHTVGTWSHVNDTWVVKTQGYTSDGAITSATNQYAKISQDRVHWMSAHRLSGDEHLPDVEVVIVRQPPKPGK